MRAVFKILGALIALVFIVIIGSAIFVYFNGQSLIRDGVEEYGPKVTGTSVELQAVRFSPMAGEAGLSGFVIGSPQGFSAPYTMKVDNIDVALKPESLFEDTILIKRIAIEAPAIVYERGKSGTNLDALQRNIEAFTGPTATDEDAAPSAKVAIEELVITGANLQFISGEKGLEALGLGDRSMTLADVRLTNIGVKEGGIPPSEAARLAMEALMPQVGKALASQEGKKLLQQALGDKVNLDENLQDQVKETLGDKAKEGLKGLFGKKK
ncbi:MAG: hypothetical protein PVF65_05580 [Sphingomonadales bacterium]|jgi:hypothetical protein